MNRHVLIKEESTGLNCTYQVCFDQSKADDILNNLREEIVYDPISLIGRWPITSMQV